MRKNGRRLSSLVMVVGLVGASGCGPKSSTTTSPPPPPPTPDKPDKPVEPVAPVGPVATPPPKGLPPITIAADPPAVGDIGGAGALWVIAAAPNGSWALVCEARKDTDKDGRVGTTWGHHGELFGDEPAPYLVKGAGTGEELEAIAGVDPKGRYIAVAKRASIEILDTQTGKSVPLKRADLNYEQGAFGGARVAFDANGEYVLYTRTLRVKTIVVHRLADGAEHEITPGKGTLENVAIVGGYVVARVYDPKPGQLAGIMGRSGPAHTVGGRRCRVDNPIPSNNGEDRFALLTTRGAAKPNRGALVVGTGLAVRAEDRALSMERDGKSSPIADAACDATVIDRSHSANSVLYVCAKNAKEGDPVELRLWKDGVSKSLGVKVASADERATNAPSRGDDRVGGAGDFLVDMASGRTRETKDYYVIATHGTKVLLHEREKKFAIYDVETGGWAVLPTTPPDMMIAAQQGRLFAAGRRPEADKPAGLVVDLEAFAELGTFEGQAYAVSESGWVLARTPGQPLRWVRPKGK